jgi:hypothetical protein
MWLYMVWWTDTNVSEEPAASIFRVYTAKGTLNSSLVTYDVYIYIYIAECNEGSDIFLRGLLLGVIYK